MTTFCHHTSNKTYTSHRIRMKRPVNVFAIDKNPPCPLTPLATWTVRSEEFNFSKLPGKRNEVRDPKFSRYKINVRRIHNFEDIDIIMISLGGQIAV